MNEAVDGVQISATCWWLVQEDRFSSSVGIEQSSACFSERFVDAEPISSGGFASDDEGNEDGFSEPSNEACKPDGKPEFLSAT